MELQWDDIETILSLDPAVTGPILMYGPPGTGKSYAAQALSEYVVTLTDETPAAELRGHFLPRGSEFVWHDGPLTRAWREGVRLTINEIHKASGDVHDLCHVAADHPATATLTLPTNETVRPAPGFGLFATMNGEPTILDEALLDRFAVTINVTSVNPKGLQALPHELREVAAATCAREGSSRLSLRAWNVFAALRDVIDPALAASLVLGDEDFGLSHSLRTVASDLDSKPCRVCGASLVTEFIDDRRVVTCLGCGQVSTFAVDEECCDDPAPAEVDGTTEAIGGIDLGGAHHVARCRNCLAWHIRENA